MNSREELSKLSVKVLKHKCKKLKLSSEGSKKDCILRIINAADKKQDIIQSKHKKHTAKSKTLFKVRDRIVLMNGNKGIIRFIGKMHRKQQKRKGMTNDIYFGVELDKSKGNNDGFQGGHRYFQCKRNHGIFIPKQQIDTFTYNLNVLLSIQITAKFKQIHRKIFYILFKWFKKDMHLIKTQHFIFLFSFHCIKLIRSYMDLNVDRWFLMHIARKPIIGICYHYKNQNKTSETSSTQTDWSLKLYRNTKKAIYKHSSFTKHRYGSCSDYYHGVGQYMVSQDDEDQLLVKYLDEESNKIRTNTLRWDEIIHLSDPKHKPSHHRVIRFEHILSKRLSTSKQELHAKSNKEIHINNDINAFRLSLLCGNNIFDEEQMFLYKLDTLTIDASLRLSQWIYEHLNGGTLQIYCNTSLIIHKNGIINGIGCGYGQRGMNERGISHKKYGTETLGILYHGRKGGIVELIAPTIINHGVIDCERSKLGGTIKISAKTFENHGRISAANVAIYAQKFVNDGEMNCVPYQRYVEGDYVYKKTDFTPIGDARNDETYYRYFIFGFIRIYIYSRTLKTKYDDIINEEIRRYLCGFDGWNYKLGKTKLDHHQEYITTYYNSFHYEESIISHDFSQKEPETFKRKCFSKELMIITGYLRVFGGVDSSVTSVVFDILGYYYMNPFYSIVYTRSKKVLQSVVRESFKAKRKQDLATAPQYINVCLCGFCGNSKLGFCGGFYEKTKPKNGWYQRGNIYHCRNCESYIVHKHDVFVKYKQDYNGNSFYTRIRMSNFKEHWKDSTVKDECYDCCDYCTRRLQGIGTLKGSTAEKYHLYKYCVPCGLLYTENKNNFVSSS